MEKALVVINAMEKRKIFEKYAIGGGIGVIFYMEPVLTYDLDVFVILPQTRGGLISVFPIYEHLLTRGYKTHHEHILIEGVPVQFIPVYNDLVEEAVKEAKPIEFKGVRTRVLQVEHLLAIMLQTNRPKDTARMIQLLEQAKVDTDYLAEILRRHRLRKKWSEFKRRFYGK